ncbi:putative superfamily III holin-X [Stackebrandtia albiflava]|uniref:Putative superfamily III holin-X n=1 Tax=Stackebrandtia albiflava TaxID=406432 RepID=A0A562VE77_9ACTN|nr:phage holin family protein [Stackebrandtia albiflava]TWJ16117.1 putative superfamily III holin-X [Stackebrandtia albiflava]
MTGLMDKAVVEPVKPSTAELVHRAVEQTSRLVRDEIALARAELTAKGRQAASGAGLLGGAAFLGFFAFGCLVTAGVIALALIMPGWAAALVVAGVLLLVALVLALAGRSRMRRAGGPIGQETVDGLKADVAEVRRAMQR